mmetsp:Transcript_53039/g.137193  ORF Transcript_53039/g.137193 Transcript_53039/m.137193 type:complete len:275 (+) Transcript_53039:1138-1962(+)
MPLHRAQVENMRSKGCRSPGGEWAHVRARTSKYEEPITARRRALYTAPSCASRSNIQRCPGKRDGHVERAPGGQRAPDAAARVDARPLFLIHIEDEDDGGSGPISNMAELCVVRFGVTTKDNHARATIIRTGRVMPYLCRRLAVRLALLPVDHRAVGLSKAQKREQQASSRNRVTSFDDGSALLVLILVGIAVATKNEHTFANVAASGRYSPRRLAHCTCRMAEAVGWLCRSLRQRRDDETSRLAEVNNSHVHRTGSRPFIHSADYGHQRTHCC